MADPEHAFRQTALRRVPLADAALRLLETVLDDDVGLRTVFDAHGHAAVRVRRITVTRDQPSDRAIVASLTDASRYPAELSLEGLFEDTRCDLIGLLRMAEPDAVTAALRAYLRRILRPLKPKRWKKAPTRRGHPRPPNWGYVWGGRTPWTRRSETNTPSSPYAALPPSRTMPRRMFISPA